MRKYNRFSSLVVRNSFWESKLKNIWKILFLLLGINAFGWFLAEFLPILTQKTTDFKYDISHHFSYSHMIGAIHRTLQPVYRIAQN